MSFLINPDSLDQITNGTGSVIIEGSLHPIYYTLNRLRPYLTSAAWEVERGLAVANNDYAAAANRLTGSSPTRQDLELQKAEVFLVISHLTVAGSLRWTDRGGLATSTAFNDSLNVLWTLEQTKELKRYFRTEANHLIRRANNAQSVSVSGSASNNIGGLGFTIENPTFAETGSC